MPPLCLTGRLSGTDVATADDVPAAMERLHSMGIKNVIITLGSKGACASVEGSIVHVEAEKVEAVDTAAAISVTRRGAQMSMPRKEEIIWKEFKGSSGVVNTLLALIFILFITGLGMIVVAGN